MKIVSFYDISKYESEHRVFAPSIVSVIDYLCECCKEFNEPVEIVSAAETRNTKGKYLFRTEMIFDNVKLTQTKTVGYHSPILRTLDKVKSRLWLVKYLIKHTKKGETVFFGDSPVLYEPLLFFRILSKKKQVKVLYFATEIYQEVLHLNTLKRWMEWKLFRSAEKLLVSTEMLNKRINKDNRPYLVLNGVYKPVFDFDEKFEDRCKHIVYAGVINKKKGSGQAVKIANYLDCSYHIHILGFGIEEDVEELKRNIESSNSINGCKITYEGTLSGDSYNRFLQKCDVGLCSQNLNEKYNDSSFPSKIFTYLANGLRVVSVQLKAVKTSEIGKLLYYSKSDIPKDIADAIKGIDFESEYDSRLVLSELHKKFVKEFQKLIKK